MPPVEPNAGLPRDRRSRRSLVTLSVAATAGLAIGAAAEHLLLPTPQSPKTPPLVERGEWVAVACVDAVLLGAAMRFTTASVIGWLQHTPDGTFLALSAACTHMGCLVHWNATAHQFDCPCHHGQFDAQGQPVGATRQVATPLPQLRTQIQNGWVLVFVPGP
jgi:Rieske Fe-S protein